MIADNLIIKGTYFVHLGKEKDSMGLIRTLKSIFERNLHNKGYHHVGPSDWMYNSLEMIFDMVVPNKKIPLLKKLFLTEDKVEWFKYSSYLNSRRASIPWQIKIYLYPGNYREKEGVFIEITSLPSIYFKIEQLHFNSDINKEDYSRIIYENKEFVEGIAKSSALRTIFSAKPLSEIMKTNVSQKLSYFGFKKISELLEKGRGNIEKGESGTNELIGVIENFLFELVEKQNKKPSGRDKPEKNIEELKKMGFLSEKMRDSIYKSLFNGIYSKLKDEDHKKEKIFDLFDMRLYFDLTESIIDYLLERVQRYKIKMEINKND